MKKILFYIFIFLFLSPIVSSTDVVEVIGQTKISSFDNVEITFTMQFSETHASELYSLSEKKVRRYICNTLYEKYAITFCFVRFDADKMKLYGHFFIDEVSTYIKLSTPPKKGLMSLSVDYTPLYVELFPNLPVSWKEELLVPNGQRFLKEGINKERIKLSLHVPAEMKQVVLKANLDKTSVSPGNYVLINVDPLSSELIPQTCLVYLFKDSKIYISRTSKNCDSIYLMMPPNLPVSNDYVIRVFAIYQDDYITSYDFKEFPLHVQVPPQYFVDFETTIKRASSILYPGDSLKISFKSSRLDAQCNLYLLDSKGKEIKSISSPCDSTIPIETETLELGNYLIKVQATTLGNRNNLAYDFSIFRNRMRDFEGNLTEKTEFIAGETIEVKLRGIIGARCKATIFDAAGGVIAETNTAQDCNRFFISTPTKTAFGQYDLVISVYQGQQVIATREQKIRIISIEEHDPLVIYCEAGIFNIYESVTMPCIKPNMTCNPLSSQMPNCLCVFDHEFEVCKMKATCTDQGCQGGVDAYIHLENGQCRIRAGIIEENCVLPGQICSRDQCSCLNDQKQSVDICAFSEICTETHCSFPQFFGDLLRHEPTFMRQNELRSGRTFTFLVKLRYNNNPVEDIEQSNILGKLILEDLESPSLNPIRAHGEGIFEFVIPLNGILPPGEYMTHFQISYRKETWTLSKHFEVWYLSQDEDLTVSILNPPKHFDYKDLSYGIDEEMNVKILKKGLPVTMLPRPAFNVFLGDAKMQTTFSNYDPVKELWRLHVLFKHSDPKSLPNELPMRLNITYLGQFAQSLVDDIQLYDYLPASIDVLSVNPDQFIFQAETLLGFNFNMDLHFNNFKPDDFQKLTVRIINNHGEGYVNLTKKFPEVVLVPGVEGMKAFVQNIQFCEPEIFLPKILPVEVFVEGSPETMAKTFLQVKNNPGGYLFDSCDPDKSLPAFATISFDKISTTNVSVRTKNKHKTKAWPPMTAITIKISKNVQERPLYVKNCVAGAIAPYEEARCSLTFDTPLKPGIYYITGYVKTIIADKNKVIGVTSIGERIV